MRPTTREQSTEEIPKPRRIENEWYVFERRVGSHGKRYRAHIERKPGVSFLVHILPRNRQSFDRINVWKGLNPNDRDLPKILENSPQGNSIYVVFPWIPGRLLWEFLEEGRANQQSSYRMTVEIALQLFNGFAHLLGRLHGKRHIIHGDLDPENLTVALEPNRLLMIDFGSAWLVERTMHREWNDGNDPHYRAPELQLPDGRGKPRFADFRSDLFSASVVFYEMLTFELPYSGAGGRAWHPDYRESCVLEPPSQHSPDRKRLSPSVWKAIDHAVLTGLDLNPDKRFGNFNAWIESLKAIHWEQERAKRLTPASKAAMAVAGAIGKIWRGKKREQ